MQVIETNFKYAKDLIPLNLDKVLFLIIHHPEAVVYSPEQCHNDHLLNGWSGAGYNEYIRKDGTVYIMRGDNIGAQCANMNSKSYGICCEGNYDTEKFMPQVQLDSLVERVKYHKARFKNLIEVGPHSKYYPTACPGQYFPMDNLLQAVSKEQFRMITGEFMQGVILQFVAMFRLVNSFAEACYTLRDMGLMSTPEYWIENCKSRVRADWSSILLDRLGNYLKG